jgi:hypothetical protein
MSIPAVHRLRWVVIPVIFATGWLSPGAIAQAPDGLLPGAPEQVGRWSPPLEEGGLGTPRCVANSNGEKTCKPVGQAMAVLPDGRVFYYNGAEGQENAELGSANGAPKLRDSQSRILDLRGETPHWALPGQPGGGASNPDIRPGHRGTDDPLGMAGVPGRPGDGLVGSTWGRLGGPSHAPASPPDDPEANDGDMFCSDISQLADGRLLIAGGTDWYNEPAVAERGQGAPADVGFSELQGVRNARIFDPATNSFVQTGHMTYGRWYATTVTLADGKVLAVSGATKVLKNTQGSQVLRTETFDPATKAWTVNYTGPASEASLPQLPRLDLMPNGKVFYAGVGSSGPPFGHFGVDAATWGIQRFFDPQTKEWEVAGPAPLGGRSGAAQVLLPLAPPYDRATVLVFGGTLGHPGLGPALPLASLTTVHRSGAVTNERATSLHFARWFASGVLLPDGSLLAVGGSDRDATSSPGTDIAVRTPELYDPATGRWTEVAAHARDRTYHSAAMLLPDGRVLLGGHAPIGFLFGPQGGRHPGLSNNDRDPTFEVWSPPYLFRGQRPIIEHVQAGIRWGERFNISTARATEIDSVVLMRTPSPEHVVDSDARSLILAFTRTGGDTLEAVAPPDGVAAPPGYYYLFVNRRSPKGPIPSVAAMVRLGTMGGPGEALQPFRVR